MGQSKKYSSVANYIDRTSKEQYAKMLFGYPSDYSGSWDYSDQLEVELLKLEELYRKQQ